QDDDNHVQRKEQRKEEKEKHCLEHLERKKESQCMLEQEDAKMKTKQLKPMPAKVTQAQIEETLQREEVEKVFVEKPKTHLDMPLEENINRRALEEGEVEVCSVEEAIAVLNVSKELDCHPEQRIKAAFTAYEEVNLPCLEEKNPNMRLSQLKQLLKKVWMKSPECPMNQRHAVYNAN
ncbi:hypothetical protein GDO78_001763, partial [Eleutherodactylus coqui]